MGDTLGFFLCLQRVGACGLVRDGIVKLPLVSWIETPAFSFTFGYILNYLRNGELLCKDDRLKEEVLAEAKFYQVQGIINQLEEETAMPPLLQVSSLIINDEKHLSALTSWLPPNATCSLLFRASTDGYTPADFHRCCDNKGPTLVVIKSGEYIFGGYTSQSWESRMYF
ncbi:hypothetical protein ACROYT_G043203 [Oculina patagonica]